MIRILSFHPSVKANGPRHCGPRRLASVESGEPKLSAHFSIPFSNRFLEISGRLTPRSTSPKPKPVNPLLLPGLPWSTIVLQGLADGGNAELQETFDALHVDRKFLWQQLKPASEQVKPKIVP
jgi:hypothetical protein